MSPSTNSPPPAEHSEVLVKNAALDSTKEEEDTTVEKTTEPKTESSTATEKAAGSSDAPPLPNEPTPDGPPLPNEPVPEQKDDGWDCQWDPTNQAWYFLNRFTGKTQWENPRVPSSTTAATTSSNAAVPPPPASETLAVGGYNPAIHGDYDPNAWYAKGKDDDEPESTASALLKDPASMYAATASFNRFTGQFQTDENGPNRHSDEAKSRRQMNAYFDVDAAANAHDGRSLKAERAGKKPSKAEVKAFKEKRRARKEEKRRAWLRD